MKSKQLTATQVKALLKRKHDKITHYRDGEGLTLRIDPSGRGYWIHVYEFQKKRFNLSLGPASRLSLADARRLHQAQRLQLYRKENPKTVQDSKRCVADVVAEYLDDRRSGIADRTHNQRRGYLTRYLTPIARMDIDSVTTSDLALILRGLRDKPQSWQFVRRQIKALFRYARRQGYTFADPSDALDSDPRYESKPRKVTLDREQIAALWQHDGLYADILKLCLLTGARVGEISNARWTEHDDKTHWITLREHKTSKTDALRYIYVPTLAQSIIERQARVGDYIFASLRDVRKPASYETVRANAERISAGKWTAHDLRRTMRTGLSALGISTDIAEYAIGHKPPGIIGVYDQHYPHEKVAAAVERWGGQVERCISGGDTGNVIPFAG